MKEQAVNDLITFLQIQQNDKERFAIDRAVEVLLWPHEDKDSVRSPGWYVAQCDSCDWHTSGGEPVVEDSCREHIVEKHPPRELAEVDATRKIIDLASEASGLDMQVDGEFRIGPRDEVAEPYVGDLILRHLALPYADDPDYRESWKP